MSASDLISTSDLKGKALADLSCRLFGGDAEALKSNVEEVWLEPRLDQLVSSSSREEGLYVKYAANKNYFLVTLPSGEVHAVCYKGGALLFDCTISPDCAEAVRRLYNPSKYLGEDFFDATYNFDESITAGDVSLVDTLNERLPESLRQSKAILDAVHQNLLAAGENAKELLRALALLARDDSQAEEKVAAAIWYLAHMEKMGYTTLKRAREKRKPRSPESDETGRGTIVTTPDLQVIDAGTFFENVQYAIKAKDLFPWSRNLLLDQFNRYVLPARATKEPLQRWRRHFFEALRPIVERFSSAREVATFLNQVGKATYTYYEFMPWETFSQYLILASHEGRCEYMSNYVVQLARSVGLSAFPLRTPAWGRIDSNHAWLGFRDQEGTLFSEEPCDPGTLDSHRFRPEVGLVKVYAISPVEGVWTAGKDVTAAFAPVATISFSAEENDFFPGGKYCLNVLNRGDWITVAETRADSSGVTFEEVGNSLAVVCCVSADHRNRYTSGRISQVVPPFILEEGGAVHPLDSGLASAGVASPYDISSANIKAIISEGMHIVLAWREGEWKQVASGTAERRGDEHYLPGVELAENGLYIVFREGRPLGRHFVVMEGQIRTL
jgi:hypothetical protein